MRQTDAELERKLRLMARMQDAHNAEVHPQWRSQGHAYYRAIWIECAELLDHYGWKWWKHQPMHDAQVRLEIVDIWHFGLSELLREGRLGPDFVDHTINDGFSQPRPSRPETLEFPAAVEALACETLRSRGFVLARFLDLLRALPMSFDELFRLYIGKNVLNSFRQAHGYACGEYRKRWDGREDNEHLIELTGVLDPSSTGYAEELYAALEHRYRALAPPLGCSG